MAAALSPDDVDRLLLESSPGLRSELAEKVAASLMQPEVTSEEISLAQDIVRILARDVEAEVRASVSQGLRNSPYLPLDVARRLGGDIDSVALPVLKDSMVFTDEDLVALVMRGSPRKHETIAARVMLSDTVSDALITHAGEPAVTVLMANQTASISDSGLDHAVTRFTDSVQVKQAMVLRKSLPIVVAERLVVLVSDELQRHLVKTHALSPGVASDIVMRSRENAIIHLSSGASDEQLTSMVRQMHQGGRLTPTLMLRALCTGDIAFFEVAMAIKGNVPIVNAQILIHESSRRGLAGLYRKAEMPEDLFEAVRLAIDMMDETALDGAPGDLDRFRARVISRILTITETIQSPDADYLTDKLGDILSGAPG